MNGPSVQRRTSTSPVETGIGIVILVVLGVIAFWVLNAQKNFNPAVAALHADGVGSELMDEAPGEEATSSSAGNAITRFDRYVPANLVPIGKVEQFDQDTLSDKIDGKAELYLAAGFEILNCQRFALKGAQEKWMEWFEYDMGNQYNAFSVYSLQRRESAIPIDLVPYAYRTKNAVFYVAGRYYIEAVASEPDPMLMDAILEMARKHVAATPEAKQELQELSWFPPDGLIPHSHTLQIESAFGFERFRNVFSARYNVDGSELLAFVTRVRDSTEAQNLAAAYANFLIENGGEHIRDLKPGLRLIRTFDGISCVFAEGSFVAGVQGVRSDSTAIKMVTQLQAHLGNYR